MTETNFENLKQTLELIRRQVGSPAVLFANLQRDNQNKRKNDSFFGHYHDQSWKSPLSTLCATVALVWNRQGKQTLQKKDWTEQKVAVLIAQTPIEQLLKLGIWSGYIIKHLNRKSEYTLKAVDKAKTALSILATTGAEYYKKQSKKARQWMELTMKDTWNKMNTFKVEYKEMPRVVDTLKTDILEVMPILKKEWKYQGTANDLYSWVQNKMKRGLSEEQARRDVFLEIKANG